MSNVQSIRAKFGGTPVREEIKKDVFEESTVTLAAGSTGDVSDPSCEFAIKDESVGTAPVTRAYNLNDPAIKYKLPLVPDDKATYKFGYTFKHKGVSTPSLQRTVWPKTLKLTAKYVKKAGDVTAFTDNQAVEGFEFKVIQGDTVSAKYTTDAVGYCAPPLDKCSAARVVAVSPWVLDSPADQSKSPRARELKVFKAPWTATIRTHTGRGKAEDSPVKHYVNLAKDYAANAGRLVKLELGPADLTTALKDQVINVKVTFSEKNVKTKDPRAAVQTGEDPSTALPMKTDPGTGKMIYETTLPIPSDGAAALLYIDMGIGGGDKCLVEVGATPSCEDDKVYLEGWRKLKLQIIQPTPDTVTSFTVFKPDKTVGMSPAQETMLKDEFKKFFTEFEFFDPKLFPATDVGDATVQKCRVLDAKQVGLTAGKKVVILKWDDYWRLAQKYRPAGDKLCWCTVWADYWLNPGANKVQGVVFSSLTQEWTLTLSAPDAAFKFDAGPADGTLGLAKVTWQATEYNSGGWKPFVATDPTLVTALGAGEAARLAGANVVTPDEAEQDLWIEYTNFRSLKLKLPTRPADFKVGVKYSVTYEIRTSKFSTNAGAAVGIVGMSTMCTFKDEGLIQTLAHELGHNMGQAYGVALAGTALLPNPNSLLTTFGGRSAEITGVPFPSQVPDGDFYTGRGHTGGHCAHGLSRSQKIKPNYQEQTFSGDCIMYGSGDMNSTTKKVFCETCVGFMKSTELTDITKKW
ncbi:MAG TPA: hypothetical protein VGL81_13465 [Polyangiaceae bacterium]|jgi:hypothetical protein